MSSKKKVYKLPNKPSALIALALHDMAKVEKSSRYEISMGTWHTPNERVGKCLVCLAGCVIAKTFHAPPSKLRHSDSFGEVNGRKLEALDSFRCGNLQNGLLELGIAIPNKLPFRIPVTHHYTSPKDFHSGMRNVIRILKKFKL